VSELARLLVPALRWDSSRRFSHLADFIDDALDIGVGGFLIFGGSRDDVRALTADLHARSRIPLLMAADVERGAGQQFSGAIGLPPFAGLARSSDPDTMRRAARITARELKQLGFNWALAPVCDLDIVPFSPIVSTRSAGGDAPRVGALVEEWIDACQAEGVLACAKHFPGHGRADGDSHHRLPTVNASVRDLQDDLLPFRAAIDAGIKSVMTAHVAYPSLDPSGLPATLSAPILQRMLRAEMEFDGLIVSDALEMEGVLAVGSEADVAVAAVNAGCDILLAPMDIIGTARALELAAQRRQISAERVRDVLERRDQWAHWARVSPGREATLDDVMWARQAADQSIYVIRGAPSRIGSGVEIVEVDDDADGPWRTKNRAAFAATMRTLEVDAPIVTEPTTNTKVPVIIAAYADVVAWKGHDGFGDDSRAIVARTLDVAAYQKRDATIVLFGHPRHAAAFPSAKNIICAWGGEEPMQAAAARVLVRGLRS
jgi:beta-glucosidase-like glycosyl hydrolase